MSDFTQATLRIFFGICLWWLCFSPFLAHDLSLSFAAVSFAAIAAWLCTLIPSRVLKKIFSAAFLAGILAMLCLSRGTWALPPAVTGILFALVAAASALLPVIHECPGRTASAKRSLDGLSLKRLAIFHIVWLLGLPIALFLPEKNSPQIVMAWTCAMLTAASAHIWPFQVSPEWLGFKARRECFVSNTRWRIRHITDFVLFTASVFAAGMLFFR
ncbi:MAG: hypothetical protein IJ268_10215 [Proteobacteria bacterium]|nr:hypothetical protein [Pseudomonadota bacterium]